MQSSNFFQVAEISLSYHPSPVPHTFRIKSAADAVLFFREHWDDDTLSLYECSKLILTNRAGIIMGLVHLSQGGITGTVVDIHLVLAIALKALAKGIILCHNHPSGNRLPSPEDKALNERLTQACALFDIMFLDNIIITPDDYYSFAQES
ncbi:MAG: JAB domain-containing protein [Chitinophagales bacterium]|nr:JAB domain-containing protein [Chitinophagales bacterium]